MEIRSGVELPAHREDIVLHTSDGLDLVGELAVPLSAPPAATLVCLHPLPTGGGFMDSHVIRKAAARLPALADLAVLRLNFRCETSPRGRSQGAIGEGISERHDLEAAMAFVSERELPGPWLLGWSFGTEVALAHGLAYSLVGAILLSPPLKRVSANQIAAWSGSGKRVVAIVPEFDDYLRPDEARERFAVLPETEIVPIAGGKHLWVGEEQTRKVLTGIVRAANPSALPLPTEWVE
jgi:alpha/beta superfamily hydrolase